MTTSRRTVTQGIAWSVPAVAAATAAPAMAATEPVIDETVAYRFRGSVYTDHNWNLSGPYNGYCYNSALGQYGGYLTSLTVSNQKAHGTSPLGFSIVDQPRTDGSGMSPTTMATLAEPVQFVIAYPTGMVDTARAFTFTNGTGANWTAPTRRTVTMTNPTTGRTQQYDVFTFTWKGETTQATVPDQTATGTRPQSWAGTALSGSFPVRTNYCVPSTLHWFSNYYAGGTAAQLGSQPGSFGTFTTDNGYTGLVRSNNPSTGGWVSSQQ